MFSHPRFAAALLVAVTGTTGLLFAQDSPPPSPAPSGSQSGLLSIPRKITHLAHKKEKVSPEQTALANYLARARQISIPAPSTLGSLWVAQSPMASLMTDYKARNVGDLVKIVLVEQTTTTQAAAVQTQRTLNASSSIDALFGTPGASSGIRNIFSPNSSQKLNGKSQGSSASTLRSTLSGSVVEVLPNGYLVVEAARGVEMNNQKQTLLVRCIVRPGDLAPDNSVPSTAVSHLEVELSGKGVISDGVRPPNSIVRFILRIVGF